MMPEDNVGLLSTEEEDRREPKIHASDRSNDDDPFKAEHTSFGVLPKMILWTSLGFVTAILHHFLYQHLNGQPVSEPRLIGNIPNFQQIINATGNVMALIVHASFKTAVCLLFVQQFWFQIRRRSFSARSIDAVIDMQYNPLSVPALKMVPSTILLFIIALIIISLPAISVVAPGALTVVQGNFNQKQDCNVATIQYPKAATLLGLDDNVAGNASLLASLPLIQKLAVKVLLLGSYIPPPTPCGTCEYNITYSAPAIQCSSITSSFNRRQSPPDIASPQPKLCFNPHSELYSQLYSKPHSKAQFSSIPNLTAEPTSSSIKLTPNPTSSSIPKLDENPDSSSVPGGTQNDTSRSIPESTQNIRSSNSAPLKYLLWNATYSFNPTFDLQIAWQSGGFTTSTSNLTGPSGTIQCTAHNATYYGYVTHSTSLATMEVTNTVIHNPLEFPGDFSDEIFGEEMLSMIAIADALGTQLQGVVWLHAAGDIVPGSNMVAYGIGTTVFTTVFNGSWNWKMDPQLAIPSLMQNISLSMLADNIGALPEYPTTTTTEQECFVSTLIFHYDPIRLAGIYISAAIITLFCLFLGFWTIQQNGMDESINFVRWMDAIIHHDILDKVKAGELTQDTALQVRRSDGRLAVPSFSEDQTRYSP
ncbi:hypothetical protein GALMADRAFT_146641 [Galerina marginata CBS 339.88]|uniref:Uncharacterized protein n=1 Tax=Galerina marginata (strain CBS 339.88) TaxID=685588 RepID=A0A067SN07_GALM3|nr:hypothetical protein GALMADRAFT_146641 [Galerina marginata CBS 339.88]